MSKTQNLILGIPDTPEEKVTPSPPRADVANNASSSDGVVEGNHYAGVYGQTPTAWKAPVGGTTVDDGKTSAGVVTPSNATTRPSFDDWYKTVPADRNDMSNYNLRRAYELVPWEDLEAWRTSSPEDLKKGYNHLPTAYPNPATGDYEFLKSKNHDTIKNELDWYNSNDSDAVNFRKEYDLDKSGDYYRYVKRKDANAPSPSANASSSSDNNYTFTEEELKEALEGIGKGGTKNGATTTGNSNTTSGNRATPSSNNVATNQGTTNDTPTDGVVGDDHYAGVYGDNQDTDSNQDTDDKSISASPVYQSRIDQLLEEDEDEKAWRAKQDAARVDILSALDEEARSIKRETPDDREKREKRERRGKLFAAIGDGIAALSNLYFTTKGAPNMYTGEDTLSDKMRERYERMKKERDDDRDRWYKIQTSRLGMLDDAIKQRREDQKTQVTLLLQAQKAEAEAEAARQRARLYEQQGNHYAAQVELEKAKQATEAQNTALKKAQAKKAEEEAKWVAREKQSVVNRNDAAAGASRGSEANSRAAAGEHAARTQQIRSGRDSSSKPVGTLEGVDYYNNNDYNAAVHRRANELGIGKSVQRPTGYDTVNDRHKYETHEKTTAELAAEIEQKSKKGGAKPSGKGKFSSFSIHKNKK